MIQYQLVQSKYLNTYLFRLWANKRLEPHGVGNYRMQSELNRAKLRPRLIKIGRTLCQPLTSITASEPGYSKKMQSNQGTMTYEAVRTVEIDEDRSGQRLDNYLLSALKGIPKTRIYQMVRKGEVRINKGRVKPDYKLKAGDLVRIPPIRRAAPDAEKDYRFISVIEHIIFEDELMMAINKPAGLAVHGGSGLSGGLIEALRSHRSDLPYLELAHRLDRDTSGLLLIAKKRSFLRRFQEQLRNKDHLQKHYDLIVHGTWPDQKKRVDLPIQKIELPNGERISRINPEGKACETRFRVKQRFANATWLEARLVTGRMHQIRVHATASGHPIVGDTKYGDVEKDLLMRPNRMMLHASSLALKHSAQSMMDHPLEGFSVLAPLEHRMAEFLEKLH